MEEALIAIPRWSPGVPEAEPALFRGAQAVTKRSTHRDRVQAVRRGRWSCRNYGRLRAILQSGRSATVLKFSEGDGCSRPRPPFIVSAGGTVEKPLRLALIG